MRRSDLVSLASRLAASFYAQASAVEADEDSDTAAEGIVSHTEQANGGDLCTEEWWLEEATQIDRSDLRELVVDFLAERIRSLQKFQVVIEIDEENNAETWWTAARQADRSGLPASCVDLVHGAAKAVTVPSTDANRFLVWASTLPGWTDGPSYAAEPFVFDRVL